MAATIGSEKRGHAPRRPQGLALTARGPQAPHSSRKEVSRRLAECFHARDRYRMAETLSGSVSAVRAARVEPDPAKAGRAQYKLRESAASASPWRLILTEKQVIAFLRVQRNQSGHLAAARACNCFSSARQPGTEHRTETTPDGQPTVKGASRAHGSGEQHEQEVQRSRR